MSHQLSFPNFAPLLSLSLSAMVLVAGCTTLPAGQIPFAGQNAPAIQAARAAARNAEADPETSLVQRTYTRQELLSGGLSPNLRHSVQAAHAKIGQSDFESALAQGQNSFSTLANGGFSVLAACQCPLDNKMYAIGGYGLNTSTGLDHLWEYDPSTHNMTDIGSTGNIASAAVAKHPFSGEIYFLESYAAPYRLYKFNRSTNTRSLVGATNLGGNVVQLTFSNSGLLYAFTEAGQLYEISTATATPILIPLTGATGSTGGDIATYADDNLIYRMDRNGALYRFDLAAGTSTSLGNVSGFRNNDVIDGLGFNPAGELLALTYNTGSYTTKIYRVSISTLAATQLKSYSPFTTGNSYPLADLSSAHLYTCPSSSTGRPTVPTTLMSANFATMPANFANLPGETSPDTSSGWRQWNADYYPTGKGVVAFNPGRYNPAPGGIDDPNNDVLGQRSTPGEFEAERPHLLETAIAKVVPLKYLSGDKVKAKLSVAPTFTHADSDTTLMLCFDDPANTVAVSSTARGKNTGSTELSVEVAIPDCATRVTVIAMGYLGQDEDSSVTFEKASLEFIPGSYYTSTSLLSDPFDTAITHPSYGTNFPANMDEKFGPYDFYLVNNYPLVAGDKAVTAAVPAASTGAYGGLVKRVNLGSFTAKDSLTARLFTSTRFTSAGSEASLLMDFFNASGTKLGTVNAQPVRGGQYRWIEIDRAAIPTGTSYVKLVPILRLAAGETASFLWNDLSLTKNTAP